MLTEYETALILVEDILETIGKVEGVVDLAISMNVGDPLQAALVDKGKQMACDLMREEILKFKAIAVSNLMKYQQGTPNA